MNGGWFPGRILLEVIRTMKNSPVLLVLLIINSLTLVLVYFATADLKQMFATIIAACFSALRP